MEVLPLGTCDLRLATYDLGQSDQRFVAFASLR